MKIIADENIPFASEVFSEIGEVRLFPGRNITNGVVKDADMLFVRSVTQVDEELLKNSSIKFVATATIGIDHIDLDYLKKNNIGFAYAPGSNSISVAEYVTTAVIYLSEKLDIKLADINLGIIGVGNVGSKVYEKAKSLGINCLLNDPPKQRESGDSKYLPVDDVLNNSNVITIHVPLQKDGQDKTYHLVDDSFLSKVNDQTILINTSRGKVINEKSLMNNISKFKGLVLDVWETEPDINLELLNETDIATPHIAGYSFDGKVNGTLMIYRAAARFFSKEYYDHNELYKVPVDFETVINIKESNNILFDIVTKAYPIAEDDTRLRGIVNEKKELASFYFDSLRKKYPVRREFNNFTVLIDNKTNDLVIDQIKSLGFKVELG